ncbi:hypothetical protein ACKI1S_46945, partial [Streptomyces galilaeus]
MSSYLDTDKPGVLVTWERSASSGVKKYEVTYSDHIDGTYTSLAYVNFPGNQYLHTDGHPSYYYIIKEYDVNNSLLFTSNPIPGDEYLVKMSLAYRMRAFTEIPVIEQVPVFNKDRKSCRWPYRNWNVSPPPQIKLTSTTYDGENEPYQVLSEYNGITDTTDTGSDYPNGLRYKLDYQGQFW